MPPDAVQGGSDADGEPVYVGRAFHKGDMLVANIMPGKHIAYVSWRGEQIEKSHFEVLCGSYLEWRQCYNHILPETSVLAGKTALDQPVYVGRGVFEGHLTIGRISSVHRALFLPYGGAERRLDRYEVLVDGRTPLTGWVLPPKQESPLPIEELKVVPMPMPMPGMAPPNPPYPLEPSLFEPPPPYVSNYPEIKAPPTPHYPPSAPTPSGPPPTPAHCYPLPLPPPMKPPLYCPPPAAPLPPSHYYPQPPSHYYPPPPPPPVHAMPQANIWVSADSSYMPPNAVHAGHDADLSTIYVCRAFHEGETIPGKLIPNRGVAYVSYSGQEHAKGQYEVLVGESHLFTWVGACDGAIVPGAVEAGRTRSGESLYVGRTHFAGTLTPGKIQPSHGCIYIPYAGAERRAQNYEVLVRRDDYYGAHTKAPIY